MSIRQFIKNWRIGLQNIIINNILGEPIPFDPTYPATQENQKNADPLFQTVSSPYPLEHDVLYQSWIVLSPRERDVTALTCLKLTNPQIAARLGLSKETVRTYLQNVFNKLGLQSKADLRVAFANWDFSEWDRS